MMPRGRYGKDIKWIIVLNKYAILAPDTHQARTLIRPIMKGIAITRSDSFGWPASIGLGLGQQVTRLT